VTGRDTGIANRLRAAGLRVVEVDGWQTRGSTDFDPRGSVNHHTAGPSSGATASLNTCINGRPDLAGPLCNVFQSREPDGRDIAYVVAAGRANHAGEGGWSGLSGNRSVYGLEMEHTGTSSLPQGRIDIAARIHAAMFTGDPAKVCQHYEWAPSRKIDAATNVSGTDFRNRVADAREDDEDMPSIEEIKTAIRQVLNEGTASGYQDWEATNEGHVGLTRSIYNMTTSIKGTVEGLATEAGTECCPVPDDPAADPAAAPPGDPDRIG